MPVIPEPIALIGSSCRFAGGATSPSKLWELLANPIDLSRSVPSTRFSAAGFFHEDAEHNGTTNSPYGYWLEEDVDKFDAGFFNISKKVAEAMDPQQRLLLEVVYEALESAGYTLRKVAGRNVGVYTGVMTTDYRSLSERDELNASQYAATGNAGSIIANRISYFYDFHGPSMTVDTACSASLVALHQAVLAIRAGETEMACVAGVNIMLTPEQFISESDLHMLSPTGHCQMWDVSADGYARGEGVVALFVKSLRQAIRDGDTIQAVIRHMGVNSDGRTQGITMPNPAAQSALIRQTYASAGLDPQHPDLRPQYFEAHGTGTPVGDPREARAIAEAFFGHTDNAASNSGGLGEKKMLVGSVKTIIGHTEGAAGLAGILKVVLAMKNNSVPRNLHHNTLNPSVVPYFGNLQIPTQTLKWPSPTPGQPRRASVNSFGFGGTNAHAIVERYDPDIHHGGVQSVDPITSTSLAPQDAQIALPFVITAASEGSLVSSINSLASYIQRNPNLATQQLAWHHYSRRTEHTLKAFVVPEPGAASLAIPSLQSLIQRASSNPSGAIIRSRNPSAGRRILGIFTGQGAQYPAMSRGLFRTSTVYRDTIRQLDDILRNDCPDPPEWSLEEKIMAEGEDSGVGRAEIAQPLCTALQIALVQLLDSLKVSFQCVVGHSSGEIAAAFAAKRLKMRDAILIAYYRGRFAHLAAGTNGSRGGMMACGMSRQEAEFFCSGADYYGRISVAASNSASLVTLSGDIDVITAASKELEAAGKLARVLRIDTAYHSFHMAQAVEQYSAALAQCGIHAQPRQDGTAPSWISSVYNRQDDTTAADLAINYWKDNMLRPVLFNEALQTALELGGLFHCAIEVGPHPQLQAPATETIKSSLGVEMPYTGLIQRGKGAEIAFAEFLGFMCVNLGASSVDIGNFVRHSSQPELIQSRLVDAPTYAWDHTQVYWRESRLSTQYHFRDRPPHELLGVRSRDDNQFQMRWRNTLKLEQIPWVEGHKFQGQALLPASAYCIMVLDAARAALDSRNASVVELQDLKFLSGITMEAGSLGVETLFTFSILPTPQSSCGEANIIEAEVTLTSVPITSSKPGPMKKNFEARVLIILGDSSIDALPPHSSGQAAETFAVNMTAFYQMMGGIGLSYTGPFQALSGIDRRLDYARGTVTTAHPSDTTRLDVSPAFLDSCFQATFATFSSPGDRALWTSFLPTKIGRMRFNPELCGTRKSPGEMTVECHLTKFDHYSFDSPATITADLYICNENGQTEVQLEELVVSSLFSARPENDYELYLNTVMDLDPEYGIVPMSPQPEGVRKHISESCDRVAQVYLSPPSGMPWWEIDTPPDSPRSGSDKASRIPPAVEEEMERFISGSSYFYALNLARSSRLVEMSHSRRFEFPLAYRAVISYAHLIHSFRTHLSRVVQQIAHRFPRMDVLDLTFAESAFTENILDGLGGTFASYRLMASTQPQYLLDRCPSLKTNHKVSFADLDFDSPIEEMDASLGRYDLIVVSTAAIVSRFNSGEVKILQKLRQLMRKRAFLVIVNTPPVSTLEDNIGTGDALLSHDRPDLGTLFDPENSVHSPMFFPAAENSTQSCASGLSMTIRQADDGELGTATEVPSNEAVIVIGQAAARNGFEQINVHGKFGAQTHFQVFNTLEDVTPEAASAATVILMLMDLTHPVCPNMTEGALSALKSLMQPGKVVLWVTHGAQVEPETAASLGLTRTLKAENPNLILQVLDFCENTMPSANLIISQMLLLIQYRDRIQKTQNLKEEMLFSLEPEIHVVGTRQIVPRVLPYKPAIERLNASRREVFRIQNSLETCVRIEGAEGDDGITRFEAHVSEDSGVNGQEQPTGTLVNVEYSSLYPILGGNDNLYLCIGISADNARPVAAIAPYIASKVRATTIADLPEALTDRRQLACWLAPMVAISNLSELACPGDIVLIEPDPKFLQCAWAVLPPRHGQEGFTIHAFSTHPESFQENIRVTYVHPRISSRELKRLLPNTRPTVIDFLPRATSLSSVIQGLASDIGYLRWPPSSISDNEQRSLNMALIWTSMLWDCLNVAGLKQSNTQLSPFVTPATIHGTRESRSALTVVDWKSDRFVPVAVKSLVEPRLLKPERTYLLVGLTRDFGQSLCRLFIRHGARNIVVASRSAANDPAWISELNTEGANIRAMRVDATDLKSVTTLSARLSNVGGVVNGAMILDDRVFAQMDIETWTRVMGPKAVGSSNLDKVFNSRDLDFFIMTSSFAAIGGHAGQANYAAANMYMNGLAANRRQRGLPGSVLNIGVIYGIGLLAREERTDTYHDLEREGYPPISERDIHHMFLEAIVAGRPVPGQIMDLTTGLARYRVNDPNPLHWHRDRRFCHFTIDEETDETGVQQEGTSVGNLRNLIESVDSVEAVAGLLSEHVCAQLGTNLQLGNGSVSADSHIIELGVDSLMANEIRNWFYQRAGSDVPVMKILQPHSISRLCVDVATKMIADRK